MTFLRSALALAALVLAAGGASAQATAPAPAAGKSSVFITCKDCGVIRSVKRVETNPRITPEDRKSTAGLVATIPLGPGADKPSVGSSTELAREQRPPLVTHEIVVRLDDGRFQVVLQEEVGELREGDKVRIERGKVVLRDR